MATIATKDEAELTDAYGGWEFVLSLAAWDSARVQLATVNEDATSLQVELAYSHSENGPWFVDQREDDATQGTVEDDTLSRALNAQGTQRFSLGLSPAGADYARLRAKKTGGSGACMLSARVLGRLA